MGRGSIPRTGSYDPGKGCLSFSACFQSVTVYKRQKKEREILSRESTRIRFSVDRVGRDGADRAHFSLFPFHFSSLCAYAHFWHPSLDADRFGVPPAPWDGVGFFEMGKMGRGDPPPHFRWMSSSRSDHVLTDVFHGQKNFGRKRALGSVFF